MDPLALSYDLQRGEYVSTYAKNNHSLKELLDPVELLIHLGSFTPKNALEAQDLESSERNIESTYKLLNYDFPKLNHIIYASTIDVYDFQNVISEETKTNPQTEYGKSKVACEKIINRAAIANGYLSSVLRIGTVYGPGPNVYQKVIPLMLKESLLNQSITMYNEGKEKRNFLYIDDLLKIVWDIASSKKNIQLLNATGIYSTSIKELIIEIQQLTPEAKIKIKRLRSDSLSNNHNFDTTLLKSQFPNLKFTALKDGLVQELAYIKGIFE
jgi:UDP-glucose 4-epimerase